jgi:hypothetical protein
MYHLEHPFPVKSARLVAVLLASPKMIVADGKLGIAH